jgi:8-oxo-dGTP pyrophosphatase MutT (NUDIX family)
VLKKNNTNIGVVIFITNPFRTRFLIQRKDGGYPHANQHRTVCLFGGHVEPSETPLEAILRELEEEVNYQPILDLARAQLPFNKLLINMALPSQNNPDTWFVLKGFELVVSDKVLDDLEKNLYVSGVVREGYGELVTRDYLNFLIDKHPNDFFSNMSLFFSVYMTGVCYAIL